MPKGFVYILECADGSFYTGSTIDLEKRLAQHKDGNGANHTKKRLPVHLVFVEEFNRIDDAFYREKQIQGWSRNKKIALINNNFDLLPKYAECKNSSHYKEWLRLRSATENQKHSAANTQTFYSHGKLLLTAEYVVLDGAKAFALPTKYGQILTVETINAPIISWKSIDYKGDTWFSDEFHLSNQGITTSQTPRNNSTVSKRLLEILHAAKTLNPAFLNTKKGYQVTSKLEFPNNWGLGSSSTLLNNIAQWAKVNAFDLSNMTFGGSGYDVACAQHDSPILYSLNKGKPIIDTIIFDKSFSNQLFFVHLNRKQDSRDAIKTYQDNKQNSEVIITKINNITSKIIEANTIESFENLIESHETLIGEITKQTPIKERLFTDFKNQIKSLGGWNGDFVLVTGEKDYVTNYFKQKGHHTIIEYSAMIL